VSGPQQHPQPAAEEQRRGGQRLKERSMWVMSTSEAVIFVAAVATMVAILAMG
jgi:hypothetical protein